MCQERCLATLSAAPGGKAQSIAVVENIATGEIKVVNNSKRKSVD